MPLRLYTTEGNMILPLRVTERKEKLLVVEGKFLCKEFQLGIFNEQS